MKNELYFLFLDFLRYFFLQRKGLKSFKHILHGLNRNFLILCFYETFSCLDNKGELQVFNCPLKIKTDITLVKSVVRHIIRCNSFWLEKNSTKNEEKVLEHFQWSQQKCPKIKKMTIYGSTRNLNLKFLIQLYPATKAPKKIDTQHRGEAKIQAKNGKKEL